LSLGFAHRERSAQKQGQQNRSHRAVSSLHRLISQTHHNAKPGRTITLRHFAPKLRNDTNRNESPVFPARNCDLWARASIVEICGARPAKTDIDWF
jgi:hypothetical protein